jgi:hypothetical protein
LFQNPPCRFARFGETVHAQIALSAGFPGSDFRQQALQTAGAYWRSGNDRHVLQPGAEVEEIANIAAIAVVDAQEIEERLKLEPNSSPKPLSKEEQTLSLETLRR